MVNKSSKYDIIILVIILFILGTYKNKIAEKIVFKEEELVQSSDRSINLKGLAFARDCKYGSAILKLNTIEDKLMNKYYRQLDLLKMMQEERYDLAK